MENYYSGVTRYTIALSFARSSAMRLRNAMWHRTLMRRADAAEERLREAQMHADCLSKN